MPEAVSIHPHPYQHKWTSRAKYSEIFTGWAYPPKDPKKMGRIGLAMGAPQRLTIRSGRRRVLVLGNLKRTQHGLLAGNHPGILLPTRPFCFRRPPRNPQRTYKGSGDSGRGRSRRRDIPTLVPRPLRKRDECCYRGDRLRARFFVVPCERTA
jgi:hypothetical protein